MTQYYPHMHGVWAVAYGQVGGVLRMQIFLEHFSSSKNLSVLINLSELTDKFQQGISTNQFS